MSEPMFFSRAILRRDAPIRALARALLPDAGAERAASSHRLVWTLFADAADRERDFLWREARPGVFYLLSRRRPADHHRMFDLDPPKPFAPSLEPGDRLAFSLRANATVARGGGPGRRGKPCDVVMDALHAIPSGARAEQRAGAVQAAGLAWLERVGAKSGFKVPRTSAGEPEAVVTSYAAWTMERRGSPLRIGVLDLEGRLVVSEPERFVQCLVHGFGRAKAFGCGLMLIRRV